MLEELILSLNEVEVGEIMFITGGPDKRIMDPLVRRVTYPIFVVLCVIMVIPMVYGLFGIVGKFGLFVLIPGFVIAFVLAMKRGGFPPK